ncbi:MAG: AI-2E family transporter [Acidobacteria bacterium]|nr:MAG: AI-2E family transporter [Acidobacteriota bacterium]
MVLFFEASMTDTEGGGSQPKGLLMLSERQRVTVASALTILAVVVIIGAAGALVWLIAVFFGKFSSVFMPLAVGGVAALVTKPWYDWLRERLRLPKPLALVAVVLSIVLPVLAFFWFFGALIVEQMAGLISKVPQWWANLLTLGKEKWPQVVQFFEQDPWGQRLKSAFEGQQETLVTGLGLLSEKALSAGVGLFGALGSLLSWAVLPIYFGFFLMVEPSRTGNLDKLLPFLKEETRKDVVYLATEFIEIVVAFFRGQLVIAMLQGILYAIGFSLVGLKYGFVIGLALGFLNIIPYLGSIVGLGVSIPLAYFQEGGGLVLVVLVLVVFSVVQLIESYLLTPKIMGDQTGLHPIAIIVAIFFWGTALQGIMGMILAIPLTAFLVVFWRLAREKYIQELV